MHRSKAACNQEKNNAWVLARGKDDKYFVRSYWLMSAFLVHIDPKSSLMFIKKYLQLTLLYKWFEDLSV